MVYRLLMVVVVAGAVVLASRWWRSQTPTDETGPVAGGRLVGTLNREPSTFNRYVTAGARSGTVLVTLLTQAPLIRVNKMTWELEPWLAREWSSTADGLTWTIKLRDGVTFSDGAPFTAADVVFTFQALYDPRVASPVASGFQIAGKPLTVSAIDDHTVKLVFPSPYGPGLAILDSLPILPKHKLEGALTSGAFLAAWDTKTAPAEVVGLGPFALAEYVPGQRIRFTKNTHYWRKDAQGRALPFLDEIQLDVAADQNTEITRLAGGSADAISDAIRPEDLASLEQFQKQGKVHLAQAGVSLDAVPFWFNLTSNAPAAKDRPWLQKEELRKAISLAVDRQAIVNTVFLGAAEPVFGPVTPGHGEWYVAEIGRTSPDLEKAKQLLASIGLTDKNGDGMLEDSTGKPARFTVLNRAGLTERERTVAMIQEQLKKIGLGVDPVALSRDKLIPQITNGDYDAAYYGFQSDATDPAQNLDLWLSSGSFHIWNPGQAKPSTTWEAAIDDLMRKQSATMDRAERRRLFTEAQRAFAEHAPAIYFLAPKVIVVTSARVRGVMPAITWPGVLWNADSLSLAPVR